MSDQKEYGIVVIGFGIAGKARVQDLKQGTSGFKLKGVVSRRPLKIEGVNVYTFEEALNIPGVQAVIVCIENALHEEYIRKSLEHGKHVLVEYPLALSSKTARSLYQLAENKGLVLHEENITFLTESFIALKAKTDKAELKVADYAVKAAYNGWIEDFDKSGLPFISNISGIQTSLVLFGDLVVAGANLNKADDEFHAHADLKTLKGGKLIRMTLTRTRFRIGLGREKRAVYEFEDGEVIDTEKIPKTSSKPGLFMQDLINFHAEINEGKASDKNRDITIRSLEIAEEIHSHFSPVAKE